ncbi:hypothetical protein GH714_021912 [Hevea brasiliensis]|uniref:SET domain-containing protein n=1 Tax=Hevea brasiliensis TaxID=3981 RepID=A0A6A6MQ87_HEVBR|nr:hypothetical protein GH714_021912 [Hevea brasiliensis]
MLYDALRIFSVLEEEKRRGNSLNRGPEAMSWPPLRCVPTGSGSTVINGLWGPSLELKLGMYSFPGWNCDDWIAWKNPSRSGFGVYKYKLLRIEGQPEMGSSILRFAQSLRTSPLSARPRVPTKLPEPVTQKGLKNRLEIFRSREKGWGVRSLDLIHAGAFICEYAGVVLTREQAEVFTMNGDNLIYPSRFSQKWVEWGNLSKIYPGYVCPSYPSIPPLDFALDVSRMRNVASYVSHSSTPNVLVQFVLYDHNNLMFPHLMLFAMENIPPLRKLSLDYGVVDE